MASYHGRATVTSVGIDSEIHSALHEIASQKGYSVAMVTNMLLDYGMSKYESGEIEFPDNRPSRPSIIEKG